MAGKYTSTLRWSDVPPEQRETPARDARGLLYFTRWDGAEKDYPGAARFVNDMMQTHLRSRLDRHRAREAGAPACPMATRGLFDRERRVWMYGPCALKPRASGYCWRHEEARSD